MSFFSNKKRSLNFSITSLLLVIILISLFVTLCTSCIFITARQWSDIKYKATSELKKTQGYINSEISSYLDNSISISTNSTFLRMLRTTYADSSELRMDVSARISNFFDIIPTKHDILTPTFMVYTDNPTLYTSKHISRLDILNNNHNIIKVLKENKDPRPMWQNENESAFVFYFLIDASKEYTNILRVQIDSHNINSFIQNASTDNFYLSTTKPKNDKNIVYSAALQNESELYAIIPISERNKLIWQNSLIFLLLFFALSAAFYFIAKYITNKMTTDIYYFIDKLENNGELLNLENNIPQKYSEFEVIKNKIIELLRNVENLHMQLASAEKERQSINLELQQSKFNPHLLYNTLSVIKWNIMRDTTEKIGPLIDLLTKYYRTVLNNTGTLTLENELILTEQYVHIMEFAHSQKYNLNFLISDDMKDFKIMKNTLQPLVENAILHGLNRRENAIIEISAYREADLAVISVKDNGYGMSAEKISELNSNNYVSIYKNYGIRNTKNRLMLYFGEENFDFCIESIPDNYTKVKLIIKL